MPKHERFFSFKKNGNRLTESGGNLVLEINEDIKNIDFVSLFSNPVSSVLSIKSTAKQIDIRTIDDKYISSFTGSTLETKIDLSVYENGVYLITITNSDNTFNPHYSRLSYYKNS